MPRYLITYPKGAGDDVLVDDDNLTLTIADGWAALADEAGICMAIPSQAQATITRIDHATEDEQSKE